MKCKTTETNSQSRCIIVSLCERSRVACDVNCSNYQCDKAKTTEFFRLHTDNVVN